MWVNIYVCIVYAEVKVQTAISCSFYCSFFPFIDCGKFVFNFKGNAWKMLFMLLNVNLTPNGKRRCLHDKVGCDDVYFDSHFIFI